jgi:hypothetical protein
MTTHVPLDPLVLHLLALSQAAADLPPETLARLATLAPTIAPTVESLAAVTLRLQILLSDQPTFQTALRALGTPPERIGLNLDEVLQTLPNPAPSPASGLQPLQQATEQILQDPRQPPQTVLQWLASLLGLAWPPPDTRP